MKKLKLFERIHWRFIVTYMLLILIAMQVIGAYFNKELETHYVNDFTAMLDQQASLLAYSIQNNWEESLEADDQEQGMSLPDEDLPLLINEMFASVPHAEVQILDANGIVISTGSDNQAIIGQRNTQIEVKRALAGTRDDAIRIHPQNGHRMKILALPLEVDGEVVGAIYLAASMEELYETMREINLILATGTFIALGLTGLIGIALARTITSPIKEMTEQTTAMAEGDFSRRVQVYGKDEIGRLALGINELSQKLNQALSDIEEERNKLASILFHMSDGVMATDQDGRIILINQKAEVMLGQAETDVLGRKLTDVLTFPEDMELHSLPAEADRFLMEWEVDGEPSVLQVSISPIHSGEDVHGTIAVLQDVTQREQLERERKDFVANVSHELRTPLTTMRSYLDALADGALEDEALARKFLRVIQNETERMIRLVHDLLQLSKLDMKQLPVRRRPTDMKQLVESVAERFAVALKDKALSLQLHLAEDLPLIELDRDQIIQVLDNVISNAVKYSHARGIISISARQDKNDIVVEIKDEGLGIPKAELKHIFKRFYRVDKARSREMGGTGLGLSITREMILAHQGSIQIESDLGQGTKVCIRLPMNACKGGRTDD